MFQKVGLHETTDNPKQTKAADGRVLNIGCFSLG